MDVSAAFDALGATAFEFGPYPECFGPEAVAALYNTTPRRIEAVARAYPDRFPPEFRPAPEIYTLGGVISFAFVLKGQAARAVAICVIKAVIGHV